MLSANSIISKKINTLRSVRWTVLAAFSLLFLDANAQDNSPYSRYGIGDLVPSTHIIGRSLGGISAGYTDVLSINFNNPASFSSFQAVKEPKSNKIVSGRTILDLGMNFENRTLKELSPVKKFVASNALFSYFQVGLPIKRNWGFSFGLRPVSRISYKIIRNERLTDPRTGLPIDSASTRFEGDGGAYLASMGTGFSLFHRETKNGEEKLSIGFNAGYFFGKKDYSSKRALINDTIDYLQANFETKTTFHNFQLDAGIQYKVPVNKKISLTLGAYGNLKQNLKAFQDIIRETFVFDLNLGATRLDSVSEQLDIKGRILYPASVTGGFVIQKIIEDKKGGWLLGIDFNQVSWKNYRYYGQKDSLRNKWEFRVGAELRPSIDAAKKGYFGNVAYRGGFFIGPDYIAVKGKLPLFGASFGLGLPIKNYNRLSPGQATLINLAFEYIKRGNNNNLLQENIFRVSAGFSLSDFWFIKRKYD